MEEQIRHHINKKKMRVGIREKGVTSISIELNKTIELELDSKDMTEKF